MDANDFEAVRTHLRESGLGERVAEYRDSDFGSWWVESEQEPRLRVTWDGQDGWLILQREDAAGGWEDIWIARTKSDQTLEALIHAVSKAPG